MAGCFFINEKELTKTQRFKDFMIGIYKIQFQILQTSAENGWHTVSIHWHWATSFPHSCLSCFLPISVSFPPRLCQSPACFGCVTRLQSSVMSVRRLVAVTPAPLEGRQGWWPLFWGSRKRKVCPGFPRLVKAPAEVLPPDPTRLKDAASIARPQVTGE